jgi:hypothetical protein
LQESKQCAAYSYLLEKKKTTREKDFEELLLAPQETIMNRNDPLD